jgi:heme-degrading monooxygenase HmoA
MENPPVITLNGFSLYPGVDQDIWDRYNKWNSEVYSPVLMKYPARKGVDHYQTVKENPLYPRLLLIHHHESLLTQQNAHSPEQMAILNDGMSWGKRRVRIAVWSATYQLMNGFRKEPAPPGDKPDTRIQNAGVMHLEAFKITQEEEEEYYQWFAEFGLNIFIPLFLKQSRIRGFDFFKLCGINPRNDLRRTEYPTYISIVYFENLPAFADFESSPELTTFQKTMFNIFPLGLNYAWYAQYQLIKSLSR